MQRQDAVLKSHGTTLGHARRWLAAAVVLGAIIAGALPVLADADATIGDQRRPIDETMRGDAALADIFFLDCNTGWAVGERGVIWHTVDGGGTWHEQISQVSCRLTSVSFVDERRGWAVGGAGEPFANTSRGVVLRTIDGGATWVAIPKLHLPALTRVKFFDADSGIAIGEGSSAAPSGVFATQDGGRKWQPLPSSDAGPWLAGDFIDPNTGAVAGAAGRFATVVERKISVSPLATPSPRTMRAMRLVPPVGGWLVGDGGLVMTTRDLGHSWQVSDGALPAGTGEHFDFHAVAIRGLNVWVVGTPGTRVLHSPDGGRSWESLATGHYAPLRAIKFVDAEHGWAAGELGAILATRDGGRTWQVQRAGGKRAALLGLFARASDVPLELVAEQGAEEGYLSTIDLMFAKPLILVGQTNGDRISRTREAMILAGATACDTAWRFPLAHNDSALSPPDIIAALNRTSDGRAMEQIENYVVRELRMWRPDVVVTHHAATEASEPIAVLVEQLVRRALEAAGDSTQHAELATVADLGAWQAKKVYGVLPPSVRGDEVVNTARFAPRLGAMLVDWSAPARQIAHEEQVVPPDTYGLALLSNHTAGEGGPRGVFRGIMLPFGGEARRPTPNLPVDNIEELRQLAMRRKHLRELLERTEGNAIWAGQVSEMIDGLDAQAGGELLHQLAEGYRKAGRLDLAADTFYLLGRRFPEHPLTSRALVWLVQFYASSELAQRTNGAPPRIIRRGDKENAMSDDNSAEQGGELQQASLSTIMRANAKPDVGLARDERLQRATQLGEYLEGARPELYREPSVRFPLVVAQRQLGFANPAKRYFLTLGQLPEADPWRRCAETEEWFVNPEGLPPAKTLGACSHITERPHLDGKLEEAFWESVERLRLKGDGDSNGTVRIAFDAEFLYVAVECAKAPSSDYVDDGGTRPRDADLTQHDRVSVRLDTDRDYTTSFEFVVDHRGWTHDACWGDAKWNPTWYVAAASDDEAWRVEAAIPISRLVPEPPSAKHVWAAAIERTTPRAGTASWTGAGMPEDSPERFGLLIFE